MDCPSCKAPKMTVMETTDKKDNVWRRRLCKHCKFKLTTVELYNMTAPNARIPTKLRTPKKQQG